MLHCGLVGLVVLPLLLSAMGEDGGRRGPVWTQRPQNGRLQTLSHRLRRISRQPQVTKEKINY